MAIKDLITKDTKILNLQEQLYKPEYLSKKIGLDKDVCECWNNWYFYDGKWYFFKNFTCEKYTSSDLKFLNELIGEFLGHYLNIDTIHYEIASLKDEYGLASESFIKPHNKYIFFKDLGLFNNFANLDNLIEIRRKCKDDKNYSELVTEILKLTAIDLYMGQADRSMGNFQFRKEKKELHLATIYDFEESFNDVYKDHYASNLLGLDLDKLKVYPELKMMVDDLLTIDVDKMLEQIEDERKILIPSKRKAYYKDFIEERKLLLK